ncbi:Protein BTN1 [Colletotrichum siamense]|uniref:Protein BTN1 n=1 Tax=Colletotrichum siamense TaxID=690259 RepID=UPI0018733544|nr:Protein BTN1 [Colletotrichum siamense]KAF5484930.1 Protein BTN1 [Colletotrichum siamense]
MTGRSPSSSGLLPMPGSPSSSWALYRARLSAMFRHADTQVVVAFWLLGLINNVLYVIILSAAQDLVGSAVPKGVVLLADVLPSFFTKLVAPYFIHRVPYAARVCVLIALSVSGMLLVALTPPDKSVAVKMVGVGIASLSSGGGELSFLGLTHYYGPMSLAGWGSGTGAAGLVGAGLYVALTDWWGFSVRNSLLFSASLPSVMFVSFFLVLPKGPLRAGRKEEEEYTAVPGADDLEEDDVEEMPRDAASSALLAPGPGVTSTAYSATRHHDVTTHSFDANLARAKRLFFPYMLPLLLVYVAEYTINQGVAPTLLFPLESSPFKEFREFYPMYGFLYQLGVFISRSSTPFLRIHRLYLPSFLQVGNLGLLTAQAMFDFLPGVWVVFVIVFWEGLLGGAVYVNTFAEIMEKVPAEDREFSLAATSVYEGDLSNRHPPIEDADTGVSQRVPDLLVYAYKDDDDDDDDDED